MLLFWRIFLFIKVSWKKSWFHKNVKQQNNIFYIDNNRKCFLSSKSAYYYDFWGSCDTEDWSNDAENTAYITGINYILQYIHTENSYFKLQ